jgi:hypothetical protein
MKELKCFTIDLDYGSGAFPTFEQFLGKKMRLIICSGILV